MLPFHISKLFGVAFKTHGYAIANGDGIRLVFRDGNEEVHFLEADIKSVLITWDNFVSLRIDKGFFAHSAVIRIESTEHMDELPTIDGNEVELEVLKREVGRLDEFEREVADYHSGRKKDDVDEVLDDIQRFLEDI